MPYAVEMIGSGLRSSLDLAQWKGRASGEKGRRAIGRAEVKTRIIGEREVLRDEEKQLLNTPVNKHSDVAKKIAQNMEKRAEAQAIERIEKAKGKDSKPSNIAKKALGPSRQEGVSAAEIQPGPGKLLKK